MDMEHIKNF